MTAVHIRPFVDADYPAFTRLHNAVYPEYAHSEAYYRFQDRMTDSRYRAQRFVAEKDGKLIGSGEFFQNSWAYHPRKFSIDFMVWPAFRRQGTGRALLRQVMHTLMPFEPMELWGQAREDKDGMPFLTHFGFVEMEQEWEYRLDTAGFDFTPYAGLEDKLANQGIHTKTVAQLMARDPAYKEKIYALDTGDGPQEAQEITVPEFDYFVASNFDPAIFLPEAFFVAVKDGRYIGMSNLESMGSEDKLMVGYTGVVPELRRRGIALALKLRTIQYAVTHGNPTLITSSISNNRPMLALNERLGFIRQPAWIRYKKDLTLHDPAADSSPWSPL